MFISRSTRKEQIDQGSAQRTEEEEGAEVVALEVVSTTLMAVTCPDHVVEQCSGQSCSLYSVDEFFARCSYSQPYLLDQARIHPSPFNTNHWAS